jgi:PhnB protein
MNTPERVIEPYLFFAGRCQEALDFYTAALGARVEMVMSFDQSPSPLPPGMLQPGFEHKVMHSSFVVGGSRVMASDGMNEQGGFQGFSLALSVATEADADRVFAALAEGGAVQMPLGKTFWSPRYGMLKDRFGVHWMVSVPAEAA